MAIKRIDNRNGKDLSPPYVRVTVSVQKIFGDEQNEPNEGQPANAPMGAWTSEMQDLGTLNSCLTSMGVAELKDETGTKPMLK